MISLAAIVLGVLRSFFDAFVLWRLWGWFAIPAGAQPIGYWNAYGFDVALMIIGLNVYRYDVAGGKSSEGALGSVFARGLGYVIVLGFGYFAHRMMTGA